MGYGEVWTVLADLLAELRKKGAAIPADVMDDLRSAKTMIQILKADPMHTENIPRIETYLENVESHLITMSQERFGTEYVTLWMKRLEEARRVSEGRATATRFVPGVPRGKDWVRVEISEEAPQSDIEKFADENGLSSKTQDDRYVLVYGKNANIKSFVKKLAERLRSARKR
jgi:hypothetical protein